MASFPNPLFDLAGLTCGHLLIDFKTFFIATAIGKSLIKVNIQILAIIISFSESSIAKILSIIKRVGYENISLKIQKIITE